VLAESPRRRVTFARSIVRRGCRRGLQKSSDTRASPSLGRVAGGNLGTTITYPCLRRSAHWMLKF
jgi:hypothetical protein